MLLLVSDQDLLDLFQLWVYKPEEYWMENDERKILLKMLETQMVLVVNGISRVVLMELVHHLRRQMMVAGVVFVLVLGLKD